MLTKDMTRAPGQTESFLLSWTCPYQNPFRLCLPSCLSDPLSQTGMKDYHLLSQTLKSDARLGLARGSVGFHSP